MKPLRIFVVDDDMDVADSLVELLDFCGHLVTVSYSGTEAIEIFAQQDFDLVFMDIMMPGMNGVESFIEFKKLKPHAKVFLMTGFSVQNLLDQAAEEGVAGVLHKPIAVETLLSKLQEFTAGRGSKKCILLAHEDKAFCGSLQSGLEAKGLSSSIVHSGEEALKLLQNSNVDILIISSNLPIISGIEICHRIKTEGYAIPTILVAASDIVQHSNIAKLNDPEFSGVIFKPYDPHAILSCLEQLIDEVA